MSQGRDMGHPDCRRDDPMSQGRDMGHPECRPLPSHVSEARHGAPRVSRRNAELPEVR